MENLNGMPTSEEKDINGVPRKILEMREAQAKTEEERAERIQRLKDAAGENGVISSNDRNIR